VKTELPAETAAVPAAVPAAEPATAVTAAETAEAPAEEAAVVPDATVDEGDGYIYDAFNHVNTLMRTMKVQEGVNPAEPEYAIRGIEKALNKLKRVLHDIREGGQLERDIAEQRRTLMSARRKMFPTAAKEEKKE